MFVGGEDPEAAEQPVRRGGDPHQHCPRRVHCCGSRRPGTYRIFGDNAEVRQ
jgi:hypothetical protein